MKKIEKIAQEEFDAYSITMAFLQISTKSLKRAFNLKIFGFLRF